MSIVAAVHFPPHQDLSIVVVSANSEHQRGLIQIVDATDPFALLAGRIQRGQKHYGNNFNNNNDD